MKRSTLPIHLPPRSVILALAVCMGLQMTSFVVIMPLFARRFSDFGAGAAALGMSSLAYAITSTLAAPFMGAMADRIGRRPLVLGSLAVYVLAFTGYLLAQSAETFILLRGLAGALTAGLVPAVMGIVADIAPADRRGQDIGIVNGGGAAGWIIGPVIGGALYDRWGYEIPFLLSVGLALLTLVFALLAVPETNPGSQGLPPPAASPGKPQARASWSSIVRSGLSAVPRPLGVFLMLMGISFIVMFAWAFVEPQLMFYAYDDLAWTSRQLGLAISAYGVAMMLGEFTLGRLSDRLGRKPVLLLGLALFSAQFAGLVLTRNYAWIAACFVVAGLGNALYDPPLNALFLELAPQAHKGRVMGMKSTAGSLGSMIGPALVVLLSARLLPGNFFLISLILVLISAFLSLLALQVPGKPQATPGFEEGKTPGAGIQI